MDEQTNMPNFTDADKRESLFHDFVSQPIVVGKLIGIEKGQFGDQYRIKTDKGELVIGTMTVLSSKIQEADIGHFIKINCLGDKINPKSRRTYKDFEVFVK